ncbi:MAG: amino acid adenylation domain-containing protein [Verrucomicrobia bacterium]|nr:amino acid adenylation domain-containing protein [Verrucomicrobiota bacterium]
MMNNLPTQATDGDVPERLTGLSPAKQALLQMRLKQAKKSAASTAWTIPHQPGRVGAPLSFSQQQVWLDCQLRDEKNVYNVPRSLRLAGKLDRSALQRALAALIERHEILRTTYAAAGGVPLQSVTTNQFANLPLHDLRALPELKRAAEAESILKHELAKPFDLTRELMLRASLIQLADEEHVLSLVTHHLASDGWSRGVLFRELSALYNDFHTGRAPSLPPLPIQFADYAAWQRKFFQDENLEQALGYWRKQLAGAPQLLELPTDRPRPAQQSFSSELVTLPASPELLERLRAFSKQEGATLFMTCLAGLQAVLSQYARSEDVIVGTPVSGRGRVELEPLIGDFFNMLALRTDLSGDPTFREFLGRVRRVALDAFEHDNLPFEKLVAELNVPRSASYPPLMQVAFFMEGWQSEPPQFDGLTARPTESETEAIVLDLYLGLLEDQAGPRWGAKFTTALFDPGTARRLLESWQLFLESAVAQPDLPISNFSLLKDSERHQLLVEWNQTAQDYPRTLCLHQLFEAQARRRPEALAVTFENESLTYAQLNARANQLARRLRAAGVRPETLVALYVERSLDMMVGVFGILKSGGAYVPLDPAYPAERLRYMLEDSQAPVVVTQARLAGDLTGLNATILCLDDTAAEIVGGTTEDLENVTTPENLAYVIYTSGSTGKPKGVQTPHRAVVNFLHSMREAPGFTENDILPALASLSFDMSVIEIFLPPTTGGRMIISSRETAADGAKLIQLIEQNGVTVFQATPATWRLLLQAGWKGDKRLKFMCGAETWQRPLADELLKRCDNLWNMYGPTETTVWSTVQQIKDDGRPILVGRPIANTEIFIVNKNLQPVPVGVPGELLIGGAGLARGYRDRPELTAEKFVKHPFSADPQARLYRTGDLARYLPDGTIECLGRVDFQVKIRGYRVELGEIETAIGTHPAVGEVVVTAFDDSSGEKSLVAYLAAKEGQEVSATELRRFLKEILPDNMVPSVFVKLESLPRSPNGKIDRRALPAPLEKDRRDGLEYVPPATPVEKQLAEIWSQTIGIQRVSALDNFFELGGHSLLAVQIIARIRDDLHVDLPMRVLFDAANLSEMAAAIEQALILSQNPDDIENILAELG